MLMQKHMYEPYAQFLTQKYSQYGLRTEQYLLINYTMPTNLKPMRFIS